MLIMTKQLETIRKDIKQGKPTEADVQAGSQVTLFIRKMELVAYQFQNKKKNYQAQVQ